MSPSLVLINQLNTLSDPMKPSKIGLRRAELEIWSSQSQGAELFNNESNDELDLG
jgi:hypothetical protein